MSIDLHVHSTASDGTLSPTALVEEGAARGVALIGLTDHDTMDGVAEALDAARRAGVEVIPGVELNTDSPAGEVHVLGYYISPDDDAFRRLLDARRAREVRAHKMIDRLQALGVPVETPTWSVWPPAHRGPAAHRRHDGRGGLGRQYKRSIRSLAVPRRSGLRSP